jgi:putative phosphoribosyl transferase
MRAVFRDRTDGGVRLAARLGHLRGQPLRVLALPRGGVLVAGPIAERLAAPLDVLVVRKIGTPWQAELAMGALAIWGEHEAVVRNEHVLEAVGVSSADFAAALDREMAHARRRFAAWGSPDADVHDRTVVLVDDGLATGATMRAGIEVVRQAGAGRIVVAVPVGAPDELRALARTVDEVVYLAAPHPFHSVGTHYADFDQAEDAAVDEALAAARART